MFEYRQKIVDHLLAESDEFRRLFEQHRELDELIEECNAGITPLDDLTIHRMKKEKLHLRDLLAEQIHAQEKAHT